MAEVLVKDCPIISKQYRMMELSKIYQGAQSDKIRLQALRDIRAEIDERGDKFAKALENLSVGNTVFNYDFSKCDSESKNRIAKDIRRSIDLGLPVPGITMA
jgi:hypothetical protein